MRGSLSSSISLTFICRPGRVRWSIDRRGCILMYAQPIGESTVNSISKGYWNTGTLLYYLNKFGTNEDDQP
jgi:hypothetical protein